MQSIRIKQVDAFTTKIFTGNPAAVVIEADDLSKSDMQRIAREMNLSETVFISKPTDSEADIRIRWFTPKQEVDLCGHATIAAFHVLAEEGNFDLEVNEPQSFVIQTRSGNLIVDVEWKDLHPYIKFSLPIPKFTPYPGDLTALCGALGIAEIELSERTKPQVTDKGYCFVPLRDYESLKTLEPTESLLKKLHERHKITGVAVVTTDTGDKDIDWHMRFFAPALGVMEDPVTGSANGPMAAFLWTNGYLDDKKKLFTFKAAQGRFVNRPGLVSVFLKIRDNQIDELQIGGEAVTVMEGTLLMNAQLPEQL